MDVAALVWHPEQAGSWHTRRIMLSVGVACRSLIGSSQDLLACCVGEVTALIHAEDGRLGGMFTPAEPAAHTCVALCVAWHPTGGTHAAFPRSIADWLAEAPLQVRYSLLGIKTSS